MSEPRWLNTCACLSVKLQEHVGGAQTVLRSDFHPGLLEARLRGRFASRGRRECAELTVAHHGIQRSGTNFLSLCLLELGVNLCNLGRLSRRDRRHKHTRWYQGPKIPSFMSDYDAPKPVPKSVDELNTAAGFPQGTRHLVVRKAKPAALASLLNWGLRIGWFSNLKEAERAVYALSIDFDEYYAFWANLEAVSPNRVQIIQYGQVAIPPVLTSKLSRLGFSTVARRKEFRFMRVPVSAQRKPNISFTEAEIIQMLRKGGRPLA